MLQSLTCMCTQLTFTFFGGGFTFLSFSEIFQPDFVSGVKILNWETRPDTDSVCFQAEALCSCHGVMVSLWIDRPLGYFVVNMPID